MVARVNKVTPVSLGYPLSVFNKNSTLNTTASASRMYVCSTVVFVCVCVYVFACMCMCMCEWMDAFKCIEGYRLAKTHRIPYLYRSFSAKVTYI